MKACPFGALKLVDTEAPEEEQPIAKEHSLRMTSMGMLKSQV